MSQTMRNESPANFFDVSSDDDNVIPSSPPLPTVEIAQNDSGAPPTRPLQDGVQIADDESKHCSPEYDGHQETPSPKSVPLMISPTAQTVCRNDNYSEQASRPEKTENPATLPESSSMNGLTDEIVEILPSLLQHPDIASREMSSRLPSAITDRGKSLVDRISKSDKILSAHAITVQALLQDQEGDKAGLKLQPMTDSQRVRNTHSRLSKRVLLVPPPIDTSAPSYRLPPDLVRTPYPRYVTRHRDTQSFHDPVPEPQHESTVIISLRRNSKRVAPWLSAVTIPNSIESGDTKMTSPSDVEKLFLGHDFDDFSLFKQLRAEYARLSGKFRHFSARKLRKISLHRRAALECENGCTAPQSPDNHACRRVCNWHSPGPNTTLTSRGVQNTFSEETIMNHFKKPEIGQARYAWVQWIRRFATSCSEEHKAASTRQLNCHNTPITPLSHHSIPSSARSEPRNPKGNITECVAEIQFEEGWAPGRILFAFGLLFAAVLAAALLWTFLGLSAVNVGFLGAGGRVTAALLMGALVLLSGFGGIFLWLALSWIIV